MTMHPIASISMRLCSGLLANDRDHAVAAKDFPLSTPAESATWVHRLVTRVLVFVNTGGRGLMIAARVPPARTPFPWVTLSRSLEVFSSQENFAARKNPTISCPSLDSQSPPVNSITSRSQRPENTKRPVHIAKAASAIFPESTTVLTRNNLHARIFRACHPCNATVHPARA